MARDINEAVREVCLALPEAEEYVSHGSPNFRVRGGRNFAMYVVNHHGDGRIALWLKAPPGSQETHVRNAPDHFFVPPYVGPSGWLGVHLDRGLSWKTIAGLVREAYETVAPPRLARTICATVSIKPPTATIAPEDFDPLQSPRAQKVLHTVRKIFLAWPETSEDSQFGTPVWRAGRKVFASMYAMDKRLKLGFRVGIDRQGFYIDDPRYTIPPYMGHNGWIALDVTKSCNADEVRELAAESYRHFALKRMLARM